MSFEFITNNRFLLNFKKYKYLLYELIKKNIKLTYRRSSLGLFWTFLSPLLYTIVLTIIFSTFFKRSIENYPVYLLCGRLLFDFFSNGTKTAMRSLKSAGIIKRIYVPKYIFPLANVIGNYVMFLVSLSVLVLLVIVTGLNLTWNGFFVIIPFILIFLLTLGVGLVLATVVIFVRDVQHLWGVFTTLLMWGSAIFYPVTTVPEKYRFLFDINPVFNAIDMVRNSLMYGIPPTSFQILYVFGFSMVFLIAGVILLYKYQDKFILYI
ncbi:polysialic acid transport protein KpsM [Methanobrevibacter cuticularis]|uniref:Polysialic acid transport protein KpsM n=1 Tax=Methanobrevibacter cuticularis TaxID=47311 RepID=A0A166DZZ9_9EURY|nr:ABC transporter permease [Methanobrevibacter cuticularis]KZX16130.1 polysialic acid transport protein KpsM [Methanobrevibacter cuticularis]